MTTVGEAIEAGAQALSHHWRDMHTGGSLDRQRDLAAHAARAAWPVLSAGLRELHGPCDADCCAGPGVVPACIACSEPAPCPTVRELDRIDRELGCGLTEGGEVPTGTVRSGDLAEHGRRLASRRDDLIVRGVDPAELEVPLHPQSGDRS